MPNSDRITEEATLLTMAFKNANRTLNKSTGTQTGIREALGPLVTFERDTCVIRKVGSGSLNKLLRNLRNARIPNRGTICSELQC